jgi:hypothetical protein
LHFCAQKLAYFRFLLYLCSDKGNDQQKERHIMLGFSASNGVEIKGRFAEEMRATMKRVRSGRLNAADREALRFQQEQGNVVLTRG